MPKFIIKEKRLKMVKRKSEVVIIYGVGHRFNSSYFVHTHLPVFSQPSLYLFFCLSQPFCWDSYDFNHLNYHLVRTPE